MWWLLLRVSGETSSPQLTCLSSTSAVLPRPHLLPFSTIRNKIVLIALLGNLSKLLQPRMHLFAAVQQFLHTCLNIPSCSLQRQSPAHSYYKLCGEKIATAWFTISSFKQKLQSLHSNFKLLSFKLHCAPQSFSSYFRSVSCRLPVPF